ncbi:dynein light chain LC8-type [Fusarium circinatum]|uniref:Dynein light chain n=1 Tax=Fusarium circinatum TaxID=48490 RepID=A0A8H5UD44_FUSCI|nr:dynein light chain LC8-type [Fusarium circinatum]
MADAHVPKAESPVAREKLEDQVRRHVLRWRRQEDEADVTIAQEAMAKFTIEKVFLTKYCVPHIKRTFDERKGPTWHCIVGRNFGSFVTHAPGTAGRLTRYAETKHFIYFYLGHCAILLFKTQ